MGAPTVSKTPYSYYRIASLGNENLSWETVEKRNLGVEYSFLNGLIAGSAAQYIASLLQAMGVQPLGDNYFQPFEAYRRERQKKGRLEVHPDSIALFSKEVHQKLPMTNVLGIIPGKNVNEYAIVGAHFDHLGIDPALDGDQIYNGADDNASGVSAVLQIAKAFIASGKKPERNIIFAFWDGEEKGLLGSKFFVQTCPFISQVKARVILGIICGNGGERNIR